MKIWGEKSFLEPVKNVIEIDPRLNLRLHICRDCYVTTQNDGLLCLWRSRLFTNSGSITRRSLVQIQPRHQDKAKGSGYAPLHFLGSTIFRRSYLGEVEGGCLNVRETSPRSPTACLPGPARLKLQGQTYAAFRVACRSTVIVSNPFSAMPISTG